MKKSIATFIFLYVVFIPLSVPAYMYYLDFVPSISEKHPCSCYAAVDQAIFAYCLAAENRPSVYSQNAICQMGTGSNCACSGSYIPLAHTDQGYTCDSGDPNCTNGTKCDAGILYTELIDTTYISGTISYGAVLTNIKNGKPMPVITMICMPVPEQDPVYIPHRVIITGAGTRPGYFGNYIEFMNPTPASGTIEDGLTLREPHRWFILYNDFDYFEWEDDYFEEWSWTWTESLIVESPYVPAVQTYISGNGGTVYPVQCPNGAYVTKPQHCNGNYWVNPINCSSYCSDAGGWSNATWPFIPQD